MSTGTGEKIRQTAYKRVSDEDQRFIFSRKINSGDLCRHTIPKNYVRVVYIKRQLLGGDALKK